MIEPQCATFCLQDEDHTLGNALRWTLMKKYELKCSVIQSHGYGQHLMAKGPTANPFLKCNNCDPCSTAILTPCCPHSALFASIALKLTSHHTRFPILQKPGRTSGFRPQTTPQHQTPCSRDWTTWLTSAVMLSRPSRTNSPRASLSMRKRRMLSKQASHWAS